MKESFLHFLWRWRRFNANELLSTEGLPIEILHPGTWNHDAGPDFFNARIRIGHTIWAGNVEIHVTASEWMLHKHSLDLAYDNVILHVVHKEDAPVLRPNGERIPCLELEGRIPPKLQEQFVGLAQSRDWIPCAQAFQSTPDIIRLNWLDRMLVERLEQKTNDIAQVLAETGNHWEEAFYRLLARNFGLKINVAPFETLARSLPLKILAKHKNNLPQLEALVFGQAGMLASNFEDDYPTQLAKEYQFLRHKYRLRPMPAGQWKFLRLRPANFPTIRLAQFASLIHQSDNLFSKILEARHLRELEQLFDVQLEGYWLEHFLFDKATAKRPKNVGRAFIHLLLINTVVPILFHYGRTRQIEAFESQALNLLEQMAPESNTIIHEWAALGSKPQSAYQSQALIHLKTQWCDQKRCLDCGVGNAILK